MCKHRKRQAVGRGAHPIDVCFRDPADRARRFAHIGCIHNQHQVWGKFPYFTGPVFRCLTGFKNKDMVRLRRKFALQESAGRQDPRRII